MEDYMNTFFKEIAKEGFSLESFPEYEENVEDLFHLELSTCSHLEPSFDPFTCKLIHFTEQYTNDNSLKPVTFKSGFESESNENNIMENNSDLWQDLSLEDYSLTSDENNIFKSLCPDILTEACGFIGVKFAPKDACLLQPSQPPHASIVNIKQILEREDEVTSLEEDFQLPDIQTLDTPKMEMPKVEKVVWAEIVNDSSICKYMKTFKLALDFEFNLDAFQLEAIYHLEHGHNVFVSAHTSAGKTVIADYAIALAQKHMTKAIYTSPIKALSNQKYRDFKKKFGDVGIITGDVQIAANAACLVMTTEILRSMLYCKSDTVRDVEWVIFDEVHYINDSERGVVWEEVFIMLPSNINIVMLSATVPNVIELAQWIGYTRKNKVFVVSTQTRPVPLEHFVFTGASAKSKKELFLILKADKSLHLQGYKDIIEDKKGSKKSSSFQNDQQVWRSLIHLLETKEKLPAIVFTFSKRRINDTVESLTNIDLLNSNERSKVIRFFDACIKNLKNTDKELPQVQLLRLILSRGIGIHHSGVLPILKEIVEILFQGGLVKVLFATETFSMGVNMPARTVVFDGIRKHDGMQMRDLLPGEYIQMAGRAGRRRLDDKGTVIIMLKNDIPEISDLSIMMTGKPTYLESRFRITYSMLLKCLRNESMKITDMMKSSFVEYHNQKNIQAIEDKLKDLTTEVGKLDEVIQGDDLNNYYDLCVESFNLQNKIQAQILSNRHINKLLTPGRIIILKQPIMFNAAIVIESMKDNILKVLVNVSELDKELNVVIETPYPHRDEKIYIPNMPIVQKLLPIQTSSILTIVNKVLKINAEQILTEFKKKPLHQKEELSAKNTIILGQQLIKYVESVNQVISTIDPIKDLQGQQDFTFIDLVHRSKLLKNNLDNFLCLKDPCFSNRFIEHSKQMKQKEEVNRLRHLLSDESLILHPDYQNKLQVLQILKHIDSDNCVSLKGKVGCEISNNELILTEFIFENVFSPLSNEAIAAILSIIVFKEKRCSQPNLNEELLKCKKKFIEIAEKLGAIQKDCGLPTSSDIFLEQFNFGLMEVVYEWAKGESFKSVLELTDVQEGVIVRCMQQLQEMMRDLQTAAKVIGDPTLVSKMESVSQSIRRDIVFAPSLYTNTDTERFFKT